MSRIELPPIVKGLISAATEYLKWRGEWNID